MPETKNETDLTRPSVEVKIPQVKLRLTDLAYLRSLANTNSEVRCHVAESVRERLRFLDLIAKAHVPISEKRMKELLNEKTGLLENLQKAIVKEEWNGVTNIAYSLRSNSQRMEPRVEDVLTDKGKELLAKGEVRIRARKVGCL